MVLYGTEPGQYPNSKIFDDPSITSASFEVPVGQTYLVVGAFDDATPANLSDYSNEVNQLVEEDVSWLESAWNWLVG